MTRQVTMPDGTLYEWTDARGNWAIVGSGGNQTPAPSNFLTAALANVAITPDPNGDNHSTFTVGTVHFVQGEEGHSLDNISNRTDVNRGTNTIYRENN